MHSLPEKDYQRESFETLEMLLKVALFLVFGPLLLLPSAYWLKRLKDPHSPKFKRLHLVSIFMSFVWLVVSPPLYTRLMSEFFLNPSGVTIVFWILAVPLIPLGVVGMSVLTWLLDYLRPKSLEDWEEQERRELDRYEQHLSRKAQKSVHSPPADNSDLLYLGPHIKHSSLPDYIGIKQVGSWVALEKWVLDQHFFLLGATGAGKSTTIKRLVWEVLTKTDRDVFVVDGKGEEEFASELRSLIWTTRQVAAPVFRLGQTQLGAIYHGFEGDKEAVYNRLASMIGVQQATGGAVYYADRNRDFLQLICFAPGGPPRSFEEVRLRLTRSWLKDAWKDNPVEFERVKSFTRDDYGSIQARIIPLARVFQEMIGPEGFSLQNSRAAIFSLRAQSAPVTAGRFLEFFIEDLKDFAGKRQERPALLVIDEFGVFGNTNIINLLRLARSAKLGIVLATQDLASLGDKMAVESLTNNTRTKLLMATDFPEELALQAGTKKRVEASMQHEEGKATGTGSARLQDVFNIDMNEAARLRAGEMFLFRQRYPVKLLTALIDKNLLREAPPERAQERQQTTTSKSPQKAKENKNGPAPAGEGIDFKDFVEKE